MYVFSFMQMIEFCLIFRLASSYTDEVELYDFQSNNWESKNEWNYPFRNGRRQVITISNLFNHCYNICLFSFYHSTSVSLGDSVIIFGGYDHHEGRQNLKNIGKVIISNRKSLIRESLLRSHG